MKNQLLSKTGLVTILLLTACSDSLLDKTNPNGGTPSSFYANENQLTAGVNAIYASIQSYNLMGREWFFTNDLRGDEMMAGGGQLEPPRLALLIGTNNTTNAVAQSVYTGLAQNVLRANEVIDGSANTKDISDATLARLVGEAKFLRAWSYYEWVTLWGGVPLITSVPQSIADASQPRASVDEIYTFLINDLTAIQPDLPLSYSGKDVGRATRGAAQALLGRVYMTKGDYAAAKTELLKVYNSGTYSLMPNYEDNFKEETPFNAESIFEIGYAGTNFNWNGTGDDNGSANEGISRTQEYSAIAWRNLVPAINLLNAYESTTAPVPDAKTDPRFKFNFYSKGDLFNNGNSQIEVTADAGVQGNTVNYQGVEQKISWRKYTSLYKNNSTFYTGPMNIRVIRFADVLANLAECEIEVGSLAEATNYLNLIRSRPSVAMPPLPTAKYLMDTKAHAFASLQHERMVEFAGEQLRNKDILRWRQNGKFTAYGISEPISYFQANKYELLPIPQVEFSTNSKLASSDQNPGY
ncbi:MAG TPA: RagB/SusD family nutrient uptake outer membrane protein [Chryseolinea sp.]|nr:RagB/SusD family nutrient uptake outer membrane protein [Chryseolinea sp.]